MSATEVEPAATTQRPNVFRRRYWIDQSIQMPIVLYFIMIVALSFGIFALLFFTGYNDYIEIFQHEMPQEQYTVVQMQLLDARELAVDIFTYCLFFSVICAVLGGVFLSHRVAGPIYRLRLTLKKITADRKPHTVRFRKSDYTHGLADDFNEAMKALEKA